MEIVTLDPTIAAAESLIALSNAYMQALYPAESNHLESVAALQSANVLFLGAYVNGILAGCGAVKLLDDGAPYGELKRMFVLETYRGKGISKAILHRLEAHLLASGVAIARLETGIRQPEALGLYRHLGYRERAPFGDYLPDPLSLFMEKELA